MLSGAAHAGFSGSVGLGVPPNPRTTPASNAGTRQAIQRVSGSSRRGQTTRETLRFGRSASAWPTASGVLPASSSSSCTCAHAHESARSGSSLDAPDSIVSRGSNAPVGTVTETPGRSRTTTRTSQGRR